MPPTLTPHEFVRKWRNVTLKERSACQEHFIDLCRLIGHPTPVELDPTGTSFTFEAGAAKQSGGDGWADVWKRGFFALEYKGKHANMKVAYDQLLQYRESLQNPPLLVVCDLEAIIIHTNFTNTIKQIYTLDYDTLLTPNGVQQLRDMFTNPDAFKSAVTTEQVTKEVAAQFAELATNLRKWKHDPAEIAHFLIRLLFCLFAEDVGLLPNSVFSKLITNTKDKGMLFNRQLKNLFGEMASGGVFGEHEIPYFNGRLFDDDTVLDLDSDALEVLQKVSKQDWSAIEPAIFGTLFERSLDPAKRSQLGAHYTSRDDILLIVEPVLMAPLRRDWQALQTTLTELAAQRDAASGKNRDKLSTTMEQHISAFSTRIATITVLDPACGSGNFLYVALKQLLDLEKAVITFAGTLGLMQPLPQVSPEQLHGIEINEYAHELAQITVWIGYIQWLRDNGYGRPSEPILKTLDTIEHKDAILSFDDHGNPIESAWFPADVIIGNPPFLGGKKLKTELGDTYVNQLFTCYDGSVPHEADLVCYWFERTRAMIATGVTKRAGLIATQSIRNGANRTILKRIKSSGDIFMGWSNRPWIVNGAAVRVSMVGFDDGSEQNRIIDGLSVVSINADLTYKIDLTNIKILQEDKGICFQGPVKVGKFDIDPVLAQTMLNKSNPHGISNSEVIKPWMNASDVTKKPRGFYIIDFEEKTMDESALFEFPFEYVKKHVYPKRITNNDRQRREFWWRLGRSGGDLKKAKIGRSRFIITPRVAKHRLFIWATIELIPDSRLFAITRDDDYFFGVLHSRIHEVWSLATSSRHGDGNEGGRPTYNNTTCFETFPFPWQPGAEPQDDPLVQAIATAARELVAKRDNWLNPAKLPPEEFEERTLTNLYNQRPTWLDLAHRKLDAAVFAAYGWNPEMSDDELLAQLLRLNHERAALADTTYESSIERYTHDHDSVFLYALIGQFKKIIVAYENILSNKPQSLDFLTKLRLHKNTNISNVQLVQEVEQLKSMVVALSRQAEKVEDKEGDCSHKNELITIHRKAIQHLEKTEATMMYATPAHIILEMDERRKRYNELREWVMIHCSG